MNRRIAGFDLARGLAVFGMVLVNFKFVMGLEGSEAGWLGGLAGLFDGRAAATFVTLAGIGVSLLSRRARETGDPEALRECRKLLLKRSLFLLGAGFLDSRLWIGDILHFYAAYLVLAAVLLRASARTLWAASAFSVTAFVALFLFLDYEKGWDWEAFAYVGQWLPKGFLRHLFFNGFHPVFPWVAFLLIGMWLGRQDWTSRRRCWLVLAAGLGMTAAAEALSAGLTAWVLSDQDEDAQWCALLFGTQSMPPTPLYLVSGGGSALAVIALCLLAAERFAGSPWLEPFIAAGRMALSLYAGHVMVGMGVIAALGWMEGRSLAFAVSLAAVFYAAAVLGAWAWSRRFEHGPLEWLMRRLAG
ncbi:MAG: DUF418 domain-containing protein [Elusimicrobia bacterium]|nr:DUF418 domain-containing protein [Elusimicrobiota bacterium]